MNGRPSFDNTWANVAYVIAQRGTCPRLHVGAVVVSADNLIVSTGYNGAARGLPHCADVGCTIHAGQCIRTAHAEANALLQAGPRAAGGTLYVTHAPCSACGVLAIQAGIRRIVYGETYTSQGAAVQADIHEMLRQAGLRVTDEWLDTGYPDG